jgi:soluble lytic murein transglycosylase-like protein
VLERAFASRDADPAGACDLFAGAGPGPTLERARLKAWYETLRRCGADAARWRAFLDARPGGEFKGLATLALATALAAEDDRAAAVAVLVDAPESVRHRADVELLGLADEATAGRAAFRLARRAPQRLRSYSPSLERRVLATLGHDDWMARASAWRSAGLGSRGAAELRKLRQQGEQERERRIELARCELDAGSSTRALNALPAARDANPLELTLRGEAYRRRGWGRMPDRAASSSFRSCLDAAQGAAAAGEGSTRTQALSLVVECGTEADALAPALAAWRQLETVGWDHPRRGWLGRRLGIALARSGTETVIIDGMASSMPYHQRCLHYWGSISDPTSEDLADLAEVKIADIYGRWARRHTGGRFASANSMTPDPVGLMPPSFSVAWLLANAGPTEASDEWQRQLAGRRPTQTEALSAAVLAAGAGRSNTAIRNLRLAFPGISTVAITEVPKDAALAYLPLRWSEHLLDAARETGLDPWLIAAVARQESTFNSMARSPAGARGVLQLLPSTARLHARKLGLGRRPDLEDPAVNIRLGAQELAWLIRRYGATEPALAAYNAGDRRAQRWWKRWPSIEIFTESIPIPETYNYVRRVVFLSDAYRQIHADTWRTTP